MPIDAGIYGQLQPQPFNNPFKVLAEAREQQQRRELIGQQIRSGQATEEARRQDTAKQAQLEAAQQRYFSIIAASKTPDEAGERIKVEAPELYQPFLKQKTELDDKAAEIKKKGLEAAKIKAEIDKSSQEYSAPFMQMVEKGGYSPGLFDFALNSIQSHFEGFPADQLRQQAGGDPAKIKQIIDGFKSTAQQGADTAATRQATEQPGQAAQAAMLQKQAAGMSPTGVSAEQAAQNTIAAQNARTSAGQLSVAQQREAREAKTAGLSDQLLGAGGTTGATATLPPGQRNDAVLAALPTPLADKAKALVEGRLQLPGRFAKGDTYWQSILDAAVKYDPSFDAVNYNSRAKTRADFTSGGSSKTINALNTVAQHLDRLSTSADALKNTWSPTYNTVANMLSRAGGNKQVTNFETDKKAVVDELTRAWRQAGGTESDIKSWSLVLDASNSPEQLHGAIGEMSHLLEGKLSAMETQYQQGMGTDAVKAITPEARAVLDKLAKKAGGATASAPATSTKKIGRFEVVVD